MSSFLYAPTKVLLWTAALDLAGGDIRAVAVTAGYTPSSAHAFLSSVPSGARAGTAVALANKQVLASGSVAAFSADPVTIPSVGAGDDIVGLVLYRHTGVEGTSELVAFLDYFSNLPLTPDGRDVKFTFPSTGNYAFAF